MGEAHIGEGPFNLTGRGEPTRILHALMRQSLAQTRAAFATTATTSSSAVDAAAAAASDSLGDNDRATMQRLDRFAERFYAALDVNSRLLYYYWLVAGTAVALLRGVLVVAAAAFRRTSSGT
jgi:hypothetical protein